MFDQSLRCDLDTAKPFDAEPFEAALKISITGIGPRKTNEGFLDFVPFPQLFSMRQLGFLPDQQNQRELEQPHLNLGHKERERTRKNQRKVADYPKSVSFV